MNFKTPVVIKLKTYKLDSCYPTLKVFDIFREILKSCLKPIPKMKDLKTIDKEIAVTKKNLLAFQYQLEKKHESFLSTIVKLEEQETEQSINTPLIVNLNEDEAKQYFSLHLDNLENRKVQNFSRQQANVWKPFEIKPSPVINVITNFKDFDKKPPLIQYDEEELEILTMLKMDPIHVTGKTLLNLATEHETLQEEISNTVPSNTPSLYPYESCSMKGIESREIKLATDEIVRNVIQRWKHFTNMKKLKRSEEEKNKKRLNFELSQKIFKKWMLFVHKNKAKKEEDILINNYLRKSKVRHAIKKKTVEVGKQTSRKCLELRKKNVDHCIDLFPIDICPHTIKSDILPTVKNAQKNSDNKMTKQAGSSKVFSKLSEEGKINIKTIKPEEVGLMDNEKPDHQKHSEAVNNVEEQKSNLTLPKSEKSRIHQEPLNNRFAAQEKIIAQQLEVIEEQKKMIFDLHAQNLQVQSKLSLQVAESELAKASSSKKLKPIVRVPETTKQTINTLKIDEKSEQLCKNMLERQEYCKMLAERTKLRKMRAEEEKAKLKLEQEEKERQEKEEEKRQRILKIKMEQQLAREKAQKDLAYKWEITELTRKATNHYSNKLLKKTFKAFKKISFETYIKLNECNKMYERNILRRVVVSWRLQVNESIASKCEVADKFYCSKLMERSWNIWRRVS